MIEEKNMEGGQPTQALLNLIGIIKRESKMWPLSPTANAQIRKSWGSRSENPGCSPPHIFSYTWTIASLMNPLTVSNCLETIGQMYNKE